MSVCGHGLGICIAEVTRGGDFQEITFCNGSTIYGASEQDSDGKWMDNRAADALIAYLGVRNG